MMMTPDLNDDSNQASTTLSTLTQPPVNTLKRKNLDTDDTDTNDDDNHNINLCPLISTSAKTNALTNPKNAKSKTLQDKNAQFVSFSKIKNYLSQN